LAFRRDEMIIAFVLSMPSVGSWDGKWTGASNYYAKTRNIGRSKAAIEHGKEILEKGSYGYNFGDGWYASVKVQEVTAKEAGQIRKKSKGFCAYDWMIDSIISDGVIKPTKQY
jgi:hypothetical protein